MSVIDDAKRDFVVQKIAIVCSCSHETVNRLFADTSVDEMLQFEQAVKDGKKAIRYGKIVEL